MRRCQALSRPPRGALARLALLDKGRKLSRRAPKRLVTADRFWGERLRRQDATVDAAAARGCGALSTRAINVRMTRPAYG